MGSEGFEHVSAPRVTETRRRAWRRLKVARRPPRAAPAPSASGTRYISDHLARVVRPSPPNPRAPHPFAGSRVVGSLTRSRPTRGRRRRLPFPAPPLRCVDTTTPTPARSAGRADRVGAGGIPREVGGARQHEPEVLHGPPTGERAAGLQVGGRAGGRAAVRDRPGWHRRLPGLSVAPRRTPIVCRTSLARTPTRRVARRAASRETTARRRSRAGRVSCVSHALPSVASALQSERDTAHTNTHTHTHTRGGTARRANVGRVASAPGPAARARGGRSDAAPDSLASRAPSSPRRLAAGLSRGVGSVGRSVVVGPVCDATWSVAGAPARGAQHVRPDVPRRAPRLRPASERNGGNREDPPGWGQRR